MLFNKRLQYKVICYSFLRQKAKIRTPKPTPQCYIIWILYKYLHGILSPLKNNCILRHIYRGCSEKGLLNMAILFQQTSQARRTLKFSPPRTGCYDDRSVADYGGAHNCNYEWNHPRSYRPTSENHRNQQRPIGVPRAVPVGLPPTTCR